MSQPKMSFASRRMVSGLTPAARAATKSEDSMVPCACAVRISMGVATTSAVKPVSLRAITNTSVSLRRRFSDCTAPST